MAMAGESSGINCRDCDGIVERKVGLIYDETMCKHDTPDGEDHPECPDRIRVIWEKLQLAGVSQRFILFPSSRACSVVCFRVCIQSQLSSQFLVFPFADV
ncbi:hypothetical protein CARUB_v100261180mg, partial [Capsella rubella]